MRCQEVRPLLYTYIDGYLPGQVERSLFGHLSQCEYCRQELDHARQTHALLEKYCQQVEPPAGFVEGVMSAIEGTTPEKPTNKTKEIKKLKPVKRSWNLGRVAQIASFVLLSGAFWFASQFNGGFQMAKTPEPNLDPGPGYKVVKEQNEENPSNKFQVAEEPGKNETKDTVDKPTVPTQQEEREETIPIEEESREAKEPVTKPTPKEEPTTKGQENKAPVKEEPQPATPVNPFPTPAIGELSGPLKAATTDNGEATPSVALQRISNEQGRTSPSEGTWATGDEGLLSPEGTTMAYAKNGYLYIALPDGTDEKPITSLDGEIKGLAWAPNSKSLAINIKGNRDNEGLWVGTAAGNGWKRLAQLGGGQDLSWSPDGKKIAFTDKEGMAYILTFTKDGERDQLYPVNPEKGATGVKDLRWSSNSQKVTFRWAPSDEKESLWQGTLP